MDEVRISLNRKTVDVIIEDDGTEKRYQLRELNGRERNKYLNQMSGRVKMGPTGKVVGIKSFDGFQSDLLVRCLFDENNEKVTADFVEDLPASAQAELFEKAQELSGLDNEEEGNEEKNA